MLSSSSTISEVVESSAQVSSSQVRMRTLITDDQGAESTRQGFSSFCSSLLTPGSLVYLQHSVRLSSEKAERSYWPIFLYYREMIVCIPSPLPSPLPSKQDNPDNAENSNPIDQGNVTVTKSGSFRPVFRPISCFFVVTEAWQPQEVYAGNHSKEGNVFGTLDPLFCFQLFMNTAHYTRLFHNEQEVLLDYLMRRRTFSQIGRKLQLSASGVQGIYYQALEKLRDYIRELQ